MSILAYNRLRNRRMLSGEEEQQKDLMVTAIEQVLQAKGMECDEKIGRMSDPELLEILGSARILIREHKKRKQKQLAKQFFSLFY
jgi:hypothetical protein